MTASMIVQGVWLLVWGAAMLTTWRTIARMIRHVERVDAGVEDHEPVASRLAARARGWAFVVVALGCLHAFVLAPLLR